MNANFVTRDSRVGIICSITEDHTSEKDHMLANFAIKVLNRIQHWRNTEEFTPEKWNKSCFYVSQIHCFSFSISEVDRQKSFQKLLILVMWFEVLTWLVMNSNEPFNNVNENKKQSTFSRFRWVLCSLSIRIPEQCELNELKCKNKFPIGSSWQNITNLYY